MAYVIKRGGKWQYTISYTIEGKRKLIRKGGFLSKKEAQVAATKHEEKVKKPNRKPIIATRKKLLNEEEYQKLYKELFNNLDRGLGYYILLLILTTGIRYSEAVALTSEDFDFNKNTINIYKTWHSNGNILPIRSLSANRIIAVDKNVMSKFKELFNTRNSNTKDLVFYHPKSNYNVISKQVIEISLKKILLNLNIEPVSANKLRCTHASILRSKGLPLQYVSERLGHEL